MRNFVLMMSDKNKSIILFDGVCNLCNSSVNFILKNDVKNQFKFASLQSDVAQQILLQYKVKNDKNHFDSVILIENDKLYDKSTAALRILRKLKFPFNKGWIFIVFPKFIRDHIYNLIAKNRYKWFGKKNVCRIPTKEELEVFL